MRKLQQDSTPTPSNGATGGPPAEGRAAPGRVEQLLREGRPQEALDLLARDRSPSPWSTNAAGVCLLRLGKAGRAVEVYRNLVLSGTVLLRRDVPTAWKVNFATALLLSDNLDGCLRLLEEIREEGHPGVERLRAAVERWKGGLSAWDRLRWFLGGRPPGRPELDFEPGEL